MPRLIFLVLVLLSAGALGALTGGTTVSIASETFLSDFSHFPDPKSRSAIFYDSDAGHYVVKSSTYLPYVNKTETKTLTLRSDADLESYLKRSNYLVAKKLLPKLTQSASKLRQANQAVASAPAPVPAAVPTPDFAKPQEDAVSARLQEQLAKVGNDRPSDCAGLDRMRARLVAELRSTRNQMRESSCPLTSAPDDDAMPSKRSDEVRGGSAGSGR